MPVKAGPQAACLGYYGFGNLGDEAVLAGIRRALEDAIGPTEFRVLSNAPRDTERLHPGVRGINRWRWRDVASALRGTDVFILGGGSLLQDATSARSVFWYTLMALLARRRSQRVLWWGQGVGPLRARASRFLVRRIALQADAVTVRDDASARLLKAIGAGGSIQVVADPAFVLEPAGEGSPGLETTLLALRSWKTGEAVRATFASRDTMSRLAAKTKTRIATFPMHVPDDELWMRGLIEESADPVALVSWQPDRDAPAQALAQFASARLVIAMRLHALIFAARCAVPFVALSYDPKVDALARAAAQEDALVPIEMLTSDRLLEAVEAVWDTRVVRAEQLRVFAHEQAQRARQPAQIVRDWLF